MNGVTVGEITSAGYSRHHGRALAMGYARTLHPLTDDALRAARWQVELAGDEVAVTPHVKLS
jgi:glycine cleavage system aminomethyltransferase T